MVGTTVETRERVERMLDADSEEAAIAAARRRGIDVETATPHFDPPNEADIREQERAKREDDLRAREVAAGVDRLDRDRAHAAHERSRGRFSVVVRNFGDLIIVVAIGSFLGNLGLLLLAWFYVRIFLGEAFGDRS